MRRLISELLLICLLSLLEVIQGRGLDLNACDAKIFNCNCGSSGYKIHFPIKQCTFFYRWKPSCKPCDDIKEDVFCSRYSQCQECSETVDRCVSCPDNKYGQWCAGVCQCNNGAICKQDDGSCQCIAGFSGRYCELKTNPTCPPPEEPLNGMASWTSTNVGDSSSYSCDPGYVLIGTSVRTCTSEIRWSHHAPTCEKTCPAIEMTGRLTGDRIPHGDPGQGFTKSIQFKCNDGYLLQGSSQVTCLSGGNWDRSPPTCVTNCPSLTGPQNGQVTYTDQTLMEGTTARLVCNENFRPTGLWEIRCSSNGTWTNQVPKCEKVTYCPDPGVQPFTQVHVTKGLAGDFSQGTRLSFSCTLDSIRIGPDVIECKDDGEWSAHPPTCIYVLENEVTCLSTGSEFLLPSRALLRINCPTGCDTGSINIWGTGIYKKESQICAAAIHAGMIPNQGGSVYLVSNGNYSQFSPSTSNNIQSKRSRGTTGSYRFEFIDEPEDLKCPLGWLEFQDKCLIYVPKATAHQSAVNVCKNLGASLPEVGPEVQELLIHGNGSQRLWLGNEVQANSSTKFSPEVPPEVSVPTACACLDIHQGIVNESCDHQLNFLCQIDAKELIALSEDCVNPGTIANGDFLTEGTSHDMFVVNSSVRFTCNALHYLEGPEVITCLANNSWSAGLPKCTRVPACQEPSKIRNGIYSILPVLTTRVTTPRNQAGIPMSPRTARRFAKNFQEFPKDFPRTSQGLQMSPRTSRQTLPSGAHNVSIPSGHHQVGARVQFSCESQFYNLIGSSTRTCMADGQWSGRQPTCQPVCGISSSPRAPFIVNGQPTKLGQWPWQVGLVRLETDEFLICGASLLTESWVITAAHCVTHQGTNTDIDLEDLRLYFGKYFRNNTMDDELVQVRTVAEIHVYPDFNPVLFDGDLALIRLTEPVQLTSRVVPVCLPDKQSGISERHLQAGTMGVVTGWGTDETNQYSETLLQADIPVVSSAECEQGYRDSGIQLSVSGNMFCAGFSEKGKDDACAGDSGGPFVVAEGSGIQERWYLEGVVSWGSPIGCGNSRQYGGYSKISAFLEWIMQFI